MVNKFGFLLVMTCMFASFMGCNTGDLDSVAIPVPDVEDNSAEEVTSTLAVQPTTADVSPAAAQFQLPNVDAAPEEVSRKFLHFLNAEDRENFELLLTPAALNAVTKSKFQLPPIAEPSAQFDCAEPAFATIRQKTCFVSCDFKEVSDNDALTGLSLMLRKTKSGWRVAGMTLQEQQGDSSNLLSFENAVDLDQIKASVQFIDAEAEQQ